jgi:hypothetical protein
MTSSYVDVIKKLEETVIKEKSNTNSVSNSLHFPPSALVEPLKNRFEAENPYFAHYSPSTFLSGRPLTVDHKPHVRSELLHVKSVGGFVSLERRVNGVLVCSYYFICYPYHFF